VVVMHRQAMASGPSFVREAQFSSRKEHGHDSRLVSSAFWSMKRRLTSSTSTSWHSCASATRLRERRLDNFRRS